MKTIVVLVLFALTTVCLETSAQTQVPSQDFDNLLDSAYFRLESQTEKQLHYETPNIYEIITNFSDEVAEISENITDKIFLLRFERRTKNLFENYLKTYNFNLEEIQVRSEGAPTREERAQIIRGATEHMCDALGRIVFECEQEIVNNQKEVGEKEKKVALLIEKFREEAVVAMRLINVYGDAMDLKNLEGFLAPFANNMSEILQPLENE